MSLSANEIFDLHIPFEEKAIRTFDFQRKNNPVYKKFCDALGVKKVNSADEIPLLPIQAFKDTEVIAASKNSTFKIKHLKFFESSGTSGMQPGTHYIPEPGIYRQSVLRGFNRFYELDDFVIWAYMPGYNENPHSSLIRMLDILIEEDKSGLSRFLELGKPLNDKEINRITDSGKKLMLFGAAFGLLDLIEAKKVKLPPESIVMETGGMKTHRREITREDLHRRLAGGFGLSVTHIHSEYGMTELLSQAYNPGGYWFGCVPWMEVSIRHPENPWKMLGAGEEGLIGITDLANLYSCSFILTGDKGVQGKGGKFQVLGRWNPENLRGCNFLIDQD